MCFALRWLDNQGCTVLHVVVFGSLVPRPPRPKTQSCDLGLERCGDEGKYSAGLQVFGAIQACLPSDWVVLNPDFLLQHIDKSCRWK